MRYALTSRDPGSVPEGSVRMGYEFEAREMYAEAMVSGPIAPFLGARIAVRGSTSEGSYISTAETNSIGGLQRVVYSDRRGASESLAGRITLKYDNPDVVTATLKGSLTRVNDDSASALYERICAAGRTTPRPTGGIPEPFTDCVVDGRSGFAAMPDEIAAVFPYARDGKPYTDYDAYSAVLTLDRRFGDLTFTSVTGQYGFRQQDLQTASGSTAGVYFTQFNEFRQFSQEFRLLSDFAGPFNFTFGALYADTDYVFNTAAMAAPTAMPVNAGRYDSFERENGIKGQTLSAFAELSVGILDNLDLAGGARWSRERKTSFAENVFSGLAVFPLRRFDDEFEDQNLSPQATLTWKPATDITLYAAYKQGFKAGGYNTSITILGASNREDGEFGSELAEGGELGLRTEFWDRQIRFNATAYHYRYKDLQVQIFDPQTIASRVANAGALVTRGIEGELNFRPRGSGFEAHASIAYNDAKFSDYVGTCFTGQTITEGCNLLSGPTGAFTSQDFDNRTAPKAPKWAGRVGASYETPLTGSLRMGLNGDMSFSSSYNYTDTLRPDGVQRAFARYDAGVRVSHEDDGWELALIGRNLSNEKIVTTANDMPGQGSGGTGTATGIRSDMNGIVDRLRSFHVQFTKRF